MFQIFSCRPNATFEVTALVKGKGKNHLQNSFFNLQVTPGQCYMSHLLKVKQSSTTRSSKLITLQRPSVPSRCKISNRSFQHAAPQIWNSLPSNLRTPSSQQPYLSHDPFHKQLKTYLIDLSFPSSALETGPMRKPPFT